MKTLITSTALALATFAGAASAMTDASVLEQYAPNADVSVLSEAEVNTLISIIHSGASEAEKRGAVQAALN